jgi:antitoxin ParD1/3/4
MSRNTSIELGDQLCAFIDAQVSAGRYASASEVVRSALRLLEERELRLTALRDALAAGEKSGPARPLNIDAFVAARKSASRA